MLRITFIPWGGGGGGGGSICAKCFMLQKLGLALVILVACGWREVYKLSQDVFILFSSSLYTLTLLEVENDGTF